MHPFLVRSGVLWAVAVSVAVASGGCALPRQYHPLPQDGGDAGLDSARGGGTGGSGDAVSSNTDLAGDKADTGGAPGTDGASSTDGATGGATQTDGGTILDAPLDATAGPDLVVPCATNQKRCDGVCVGVTDPKYGCDPATCDVSGCPAIPGATLVCQGSLCVVGTCGTGTKKCGDRCVDANDPAYGCGAATCDATTCPNPGTGGSVICQAGACVIGTCGTGTKKCANRCVAVTDPTYGCGASTCDASACPAAGTGTLICQAGACVVGTCGAGTKKCGNNCVPTDTNNGCGDTARCTPCAASEACVGTPVTQCQCVPEAATVTCIGKACGPATGNCGQAVTCPNTCTGVNTCGGGTAGPNGCGCTPNNAAACASKACGPATNNCGQAVTCANTCTGINTCGGGTAGPNGCGCTPPVNMATACLNKCGAIPNGCNGIYMCSTCGTNLKCDPATSTCVDICTGGGTGTASHCCKASDCPANLPVCMGTTCVARTLGQACAAGIECGTGNCVNGICCATSTCPTCQACNIGSTGMCSPIASGTACGTGGMACSGGQCVCNTASNCNGCCMSTTQCMPLASEGARSCGTGGNQCRDCGAGMTCSNGNCSTIACNGADFTQSSCGAMYVCVSGTCKGLVGATGCTSDSTCVGRCFQGTCTGTVGVPGRVTCNGGGAYLTCDTATGCSCPTADATGPGCGCGGVSSGDQNFISQCDGPADCISTDPTFPSGGCCFEQTTLGGLTKCSFGRTTCPLSSDNVNLQPTVCDPTASSACPAGKTCTKAAMMYICM